MAGPLDPVACAAFLILAFSTAGVFQTLWLTTPFARRMNIPLDGGRTWRGRPVLGSNKDVRGFVVMLPATAASFALLAMTIAGGRPESYGLWPLPAWRYAALGGWAALGFMAGELPNSFLKRQLDVAPGAVAGSRLLRVLQLAGDRLDSPLGMLVALSLVVPTPWQTWALVLFIGPVIHLAFSVLLFRLGIKPRAA